MLLYHASPTAGITVLEPRVSNHGRPLVYLSDLRENVLVYLSNAVEKFCRGNGISPQGPYSKWGSYGFTKDGLLQLDEYWPNATKETYQGAAGYIYTVEAGDGVTPLPDIPHAFTSQVPLEVNRCEFVPDAYEALKQAEAAGKLRLRTYGENSQGMLDWIKKSTWQDYQDPKNPSHYREFLKAKFPHLSEE